MGPLTVPIPCRSCAGGARAQQCADGAKGAVCVDHISGWLSTPCNPSAHVHYRMERTQEAGCDRGHVTRVLHATGWGGRGSCGAGVAQRSCPQALPACPVPASALSIRAVHPAPCKGEDAGEPAPSCPTQEAPMTSVHGARARLYGAAFGPPGLRTASMHALASAHFPLFRQS